MNGIQKINKLLITLILLLGISACFDSSRSEPTQPPPTLSADATLSALVLSAGDIVPTFASGTTNYTLTTSSDSTTGTATASQANATITVNGIAVSSGTESAAIPLAIGNTAISIVVTAEDGSTTQTYTLTINRLPAVSTDATLSSLTVSAGAISPVFASGTIDYTLTTSNTSTTVTATANQANATVSVNGTAVASGAASASIALAVGDTAISIEVTAEDGSTSQSYTVTITRLPAVSTDATLSGLTVSAGTISPVFASGTINYTLTTSSTSTTVTPTVNQANATVTVNGTAVVSGAASASIALAVGDTTINILVTAEDGSTTQTYSVIINRPASVSTDATLSALTLSAGTFSPGFASGTTNYTLSTSSTSTTVTATVNQANATVTVNGTAVTSGAASASIPLATANTAINILVTAEDGSTTQNYMVIVTNGSVTTSLELFDPTPGAGDEFGTLVVQLANGNIVVSDPNDSTFATRNGAVHLYSPTSPTPIASIYGDVEDDQLGSTSITALGNNNFVIASQFDDEGGILNTGSVRLMNGTTGAQIGASLVGAMGGELGSDGITVLSTNNYVIASSSDLQGSVRLVDGTTGVQIADMVGVGGEQRLGLYGATALGNDNYVVLVSSRVIGGQNSVRLVNGSTGVAISTMVGGVGANFGIQSNGLSMSGIAALGNNNYVIASPKDDVGENDTGSVRLVDGSTGAQIAILVGDFQGNKLGSDGITVLSNNNYVISTTNYDENGIRSVGLVQLVDGSTGVLIASLVGDFQGDLLGNGGITALGNNNYVIASPNDDVGENDNGSVRLMNGSTGVQIGATLVGDSGDQLGSDGATALNNNNYVIGSSGYNTDTSRQRAGLVQLVDGATGVQIGTAIAGDERSDQLGSDGITALGNNNYVIVSSSDDERGQRALDIGSVQLVNGSTGVQIGSTIIGTEGRDLLSAGVTKPVSGGNYYILSQPFADNAGQIDSGMVRIIEQ